MDQSVEQDVAFRYQRVRLLHGALFLWRRFRTAVPYLHHGAMHHEIEAAPETKARR